MGFPTTLDEDSLKEYGMELIRILIGFSIVGSVLATSLAIAKCIISRRKKNDYYEDLSRSQRWCYIIICSILLAISIATCAVGWSYNTTCDDEFVYSLNTADDVMVKADGVMLGLNGTLNNLVGDLDEELDKAINITTNLSFVLVPIKYAVSIIPPTIATVRNMENVTVAVISNLSSVNSDLDYLRTQQAKGVISGVPLKVEIPNVDTSDIEVLDSAIENAYSIQDQLQNVSNNVENTIVDIQNVQVEKIREASEEYQKQADSLSTFLTSTHNTIDSTRASFEDGSDGAVHYSNIRKGVVAGILIFPIVVAGIGLLGNIFRSKILLKLSIFLGSFALFWYISIAGVNYAVFYAARDFCVVKDTVVVNFVAQQGNDDISIPGLNRTLKLSTALPLIMNCSGNTSIIDVFQAYQIVDDLNNKVKDEGKQIGDQVGRLNVTRDYDQTKQFIDQFANETLDLDFTQGHNITAIKEKNKEVERQIEDLSRFGFSEAAYNQSLDNVNNITTYVVRNDLTVVSRFYDSSNITTLECRNYPYDNIDKQTQDELCTRANVSISLTYVRDDVIAQVKEINNRIDDINDKLDGLVYANEQLNITQNAIHNTLVTLESNVDAAYSSSINIINKVLEIVNTIIAVVNGGTQNLVDQTRCEFLGDAYASLSYSVCEKLTPSLSVITAMMLVGACTMFIGAVVNLVADARIVKTQY